jgi:sugar-specific transcriptional regulator TrmB
METYDSYHYLYTSLDELGLSDAEKRVYITSLSLGPSPISALAEHIGIARPNVYKIIDSLRSRGLVPLEGKEKYARNFMVEPPSVVLELLRKKRETIAETDMGLSAELPELFALYRQGEGDTKIKVLKGKEQYVKVFRQSVEEERHEIQFCGSAGDFINFISWDVENAWIRERLKRNVHIKVLILPGETAHTLREKDTQELRETRILKSGEQFKSSFMLYGNKLVFWQPEAPLAVLVEDQYIVQMMREMFRLLWKDGV